MAWDSPKVFGCTIFVHIPSKDRFTLDPRATKCIFLGYYPTQKDYKCYHLLSQQKFVTMDINFFEDQSYYQKTNLQEKKLEVEDQSQDWSLPLPMPTWEGERHGIMGEPKKSELQNQGKPPDSELFVYSRRP